MNHNRRTFISCAIAGGTLAALSLPASGKTVNRGGSRVHLAMHDGILSMLGLEYPIFQAPTSTVAGPATTVAVSNGGGLGAIGLTWTPPEQTRQIVRATKEKTTRAFAVNYVLSFEPTSLSAALEAGAPVIQFSWGIPDKDVASLVKKHGAKLGIQVTSAGGAKLAIDRGADYLVCQGLEAGGHVQAHRPLLEGLAEVLEVSNGVPVVASGGIGDGRGIRSVLTAGAAGAMLGTRFVATAESTAHEDYKNALTRASAGDTVLTVCFDGGWSNAPHRVLRNSTFTDWESAGCPPQGRRPGEGDVIAVSDLGAKQLRYSNDAPRDYDRGQITEQAMYAGRSVDAIRDVPPAEELVERLWRECISG